ncbi:hypothetical protein TNCV_4976631 [Trichonephila clavipes]|nr:hypothetical protein TNCV_4976631 [Trichonephila clavipes]
MAAHKKSSPKREVNSLQRQIKTQISEHRNNSWHNSLSNIHPEDNSLYNLKQKLVKKPTIIPLLAGRNGILYSDDEKAEEFKNNLEATFLKKIRSLTTIKS